MYNVHQIQIAYISGLPCPDSYWVGTLKILIQAKKLKYVQWNCLHIFQEIWQIITLWAIEICMKVTGCEYTNTRSLPLNWWDIFQTSCLLQLVRMVDVEMVRNRTYIRHQVVEMEEDMTTEFKGHRSILMEDENPKHWNPNNVRSHGRTRQPWSRGLYYFKKFFTIADMRGWSFLAALAEL